MGAILRLSKPAALQAYGHGVGPNDAPPPYKTGVSTAAQSQQHVVVAPAEQQNSVGEMGVPQ